MNRRQQREFYQKHALRLYNQAFRILCDSLEAEDVMQETLIRYFDSPVVFKSEQQESAWLTRVCVRMSIDILRKRRRRDTFMEDYSITVDQQTGPPEDEDLTGITVTDIVEQIQSLPDPYRIVLDLVLIEELDYSEVSQMTGDKEVTLRSQFSRGRKMLTAKLKKLIEERNG